MWTVEGKGRGSSLQEGVSQYIYLDYSRVEFLSCIKNKKNKKKIKKIKNLDGKISYTSAFKNVGTKMIFSLLLYSKIHMDNREI